MKRSQAGNALIEFVIVVPFLTLLLMGAIETGRYAYFSILVGNAARAGLQYGAQNGATAVDGTGIAAAAGADGSSKIASLNVKSTSTCACWNGSSNTPTPCAPVPSCFSGHPVEYVTVTVSGTAHALLDYYLIPSTLAVTQTATQRVVNQ